MSLRTFSYGGGVQSTAALVLAAQGKIDYRIFLFANVGDDSEHPATLRYVHEVATPFAKANGIELHELHRKWRDGSTQTLYGKLTGTRPCHRCKATGETRLADADLPGTPENMLPRPRQCPRCHGTGQAESRSLPIPVRMSNGAPGTRSCTFDFKITVIGKWLKAHGASPDNPATVGVGISLDEIQRINNRKNEPYERLAYPLVGLPDDEDTGLRLRRDDCERLITAEPLPPSMVEPLKAAFDELPAVTRHDLIQFNFTRMPRPPKSACYFCPFHRPETWHDQRRSEPELFAKACDLEDLLNARRDELGKDHVYLTRFARPLRVAIPDGIDLLPIFDADDAQCDNGWCMT